MFKKLLAVAVAVVVMLCTASVAYADNEFTLTIGEVKAKAGATVEVDVTISGNPGIWGAEFRIRYDSRSLNLTEVVSGNVFEASQGDYSYNEGGQLNNIGTTETYISYYGGDDFKDISTDGVLCTLKFYINASAEAAVYNIDAVLTEDSFFDADAVSHECVVKAGKITVNDGTAIVTNSMPATTVTTAAQISSTASDSTDENNTSADKTNATVSANATAADNTDTAETTSNAAVEITNSANDDNDSPNTALYVVIAIVIAAIVIGAVLIITKQRKPAVEKEMPSESEEDNTEDKE